MSDNPIRGGQGRNERDLYSSAFALVVVCIVAACVGAILMIVGGSPPGGQ